MSVLETTTVTVTIEAPFERVADDLADPARHPEWATEFFAGPAKAGRDGEVIVSVPQMGGDVSFRIDADQSRGILDLYLAPVGTAFGPPLPVRLVRNGDGVDVLWTLARPPHVANDDWSQGLESMRRELVNLKARLETDS